jgi:hypothetical protein
MKIHQDQWKSMKIRHMVVFCEVIELWLMKKWISSHILITGGYCGYQENVGMQPTIWWEYMRISWNINTLIFGSVWKCGSHPPKTGHAKPSNLTHK